jgi:signal peptidase II
LRSAIRKKSLWGLFAVLVVVDQLSKIIVDATLPLHHSIPVIDGFFNLTYIRNTGAAFGIFAEFDASFRRPFLILFSLAAIGFILHLLGRLPADEKMAAVALVLILGGAVGNLIDRLLYGEVIDFFDFYWSRFHWPAFNFADSYITIGVALLAFRLIFSRGKDPFAPAGE